MNCQGGGEKGALWLNPAPRLPAGKANRESVIHLLWMPGRMVIIVLMILVVLVENLFPYSILDKE